MPPGLTTSTRSRSVSLPPPMFTFAPTTAKRSGIAVDVTIAKDLSCFAQTQPMECAMRFPPTEGIMADPKINKHKEYARYANHCLEMLTVAKDQESRSIQREMANEWLRLADTLIAHHPVKPRGRRSR